MNRRQFLTRTAPAVVGVAIGKEVVADNKPPDNKPLLALTDGNYTGRRSPPEYTTVNINTAGSRFTAGDIAEEIAEQINKLTGNGQFRLNVY